MNDPNRTTWTEWLTAYMDGELTPEQMAKAERDLQHDPAARELLAELRSISRAVARAPRIGAPAHLSESIQRRIELLQLDDPSSAPRAPRGMDGGGLLRWSGRRWFGMAAGFALVVMLVGYGWSGRVSSRMANVPPSGEALTSTVDVSRDAPKDEFAGGASEKLLELATLEQKLAAGVSADQILKHRFDVEPQRLQIALASSRDTHRIDEPLHEALRNAGVAPLQDSSAGSTVGLSAASITGGDMPPAFFIEGQAGTNFDDSATKQFIVCGTPERVGRVVEELSQSMCGAKALSQAGPVQAHGWENARELVSISGGQALAMRAGEHDATQPQAVPLHAEPLLLTHTRSGDTGTHEFDSASSSARTTAKETPREQAPSATYKIDATPQASEVAGESGAESAAEVDGPVDKKRQRDAGPPATPIEEAFAALIDALEFDAARNASPADAPSAAGLQVASDAEDSSNPAVAPGESYAERQEDRQTEPPSSSQEGADGLAPRRSSLVERVLTEAGSSTASADATTHDPMAQVDGRRPHPADIREGLMPSQRAIPVVPRSGTGEAASVMLGGEFFAPPHKLVTLVIEIHTARPQPSSPFPRPPHESAPTDVRPPAQ